MYGMPPIGVSSLKSLLSTAKKMHAPLRMAAGVANGVSWCFGV
jgi:hypothetical protein